MKGEYMSLFGACKTSDIFVIVEEEDKPPRSYTQHDLDELLESGKIKEGSIVTKLSVMDRWSVVVKRQLQRLNGEAKL